VTLPANVLWVLADSLQEPFFGHFMATVRA